MYTGVASEASLSGTPSFSLVAYPATFYTRPAWPLTAASLLTTTSAPAIGPSSAPHRSSCGDGATCCGDSCIRLVRASDHHSCHRWLLNASPGGGRCPRQGCTRSASLRFAPAEDARAWDTERLRGACHRICSTLATNSALPDKLHRLEPCEAAGSPVSRGRNGQHSACPRNRSVCQLHPSLRQICRLPNL